MVFSNKFVGRGRRASAWLITCSLVMVSIVSERCLAQRAPTPPREGGSTPVVIIEDFGGAGTVPSSPPWWVVPNPIIPTPRPGTGDNGGGNGGGGSSGGGTTSPPTERTQTATCNCYHTTWYFSGYPSSDINCQDESKEMVNHHAVFSSALIITPSTLPDRSHVDVCNNGGMSNFMVTREHTRWNWDKCGETSRFISIAFDPTYRCANPF